MATLFAEPKDPLAALGLNGAGSSPSRAGMFGSRLYRFGGPTGIEPIPDRSGLAHALCAVV